MSEAIPPIFPAAREPRVPLVLAGFIFLSLLAHTATFFLFQVIYPQHVTLPPSSPQVTLLTAETPAQQALLRWVAAEDPALVAATVGAQPPGLFQLRYQPSYSVLRTPPRSAPDPAERPEPAPSPLVLAPDALPHATAAAAPRPAVRTTVTLSGPLAGRRLTSTDGPVLHATLPLQSTRFLVALTARGEVRYTFLQQSSGDEQADATAARWLEAAAFSTGAAPLTWGEAIVHWGDEAYAPPAP